MARSAPQPVVRHLPEIGVTTISMWIYNCYVVHDGGDGRPFVVDLGLATQVPLVAAALRQHGSDLSELSAAIATHGHADHVGGLPGLHEAHGTPVLLPEAIDGMRAGRVPLHPPGPRAVAQILPVLASQPRDLVSTRSFLESGKVIGWDGKGVHLPFEPAAWLADGDHLPGLPHWQVLNTPGHSADSTCLYHAPSKLLLSGDAVLSADGRAWITPEVTDPEAAAVSEERLRALDVEHLLPGHGLAVQGERVLARARAHTDRAPLTTKLACFARVLANRAG